MATHDGNGGATHGGAENGALARILKRPGLADSLEVLANDMSAPDVTTFLLRVMRGRASRASPATLMRRYGADRFVAPAAVPFERLRRAEDALLAALPSGVEMLELAPVVPLGAHSAIAHVDQNNVVSTIRATEVAADPTCGLALEAAARRRRLLRQHPRSTEAVRLGAIQRVTRGQRIEGSTSFAHFRMFGLVTAGRDEGNLIFERQSASEHVRFAAEASLAAGARSVRIELTDFGGGHQSVLDAARLAVSTHRGVEVVDRPDRTAARGYYPGFCFKAFASLGPTSYEVADGGHVGWTRQLVASAKERLMISGVGLDRVALLLAGL